MAWSKSYESAGRAESAPTPQSDSFARVKQQLQDIQGTGNPAPPLSPSELENSIYHLGLATDLLDKNINELAQRLQPVMVETLGKADRIETEGKVEARSEAARRICSFTRRLNESNEILGRLFQLLAV